MGGLAMAFYLHARCLEAWEGSTEWSLIAKVVNAVDHLADLWPLAMTRSIVLLG